MVKACINILLIGIHALSMGTNNAHRNSVAAKPDTAIVAPEPPPAEPPADCICRVAEGFIGIKEATGHNDGYWVEKWLKGVGRYKGDAWCVAFAHAVHDSCGVWFPYTGYSPSVFNTPETYYKRAKKGSIEDMQAGDTGGLYFANLKRVAHTFLVVGKTDKYAVTVEGNTSTVNAGTGTREGDGVYKKFRLKGTIYCLARYNQPKALHK